MCCINNYVRAHQTRRSGRLLHLGFNEVTQFLSKSDVLVALSVFSSPYFFPPIIILFLQYSHKRSWNVTHTGFDVQYFIPNILLRSLFVFVKGRGTCGNGKRNAKIWIDFRKSPRFSLTSPLSQERERSQVALFLLCVVYYIVMAFNTTFNNISAMCQFHWWSMAQYRENHRPVASHWQTLSYNVVLSTPCHEWDSNSQL